MEKTTQTIIAYDNEYRKIFIDLKDVQEKYLTKDIGEVIDKADVVIVSNINYARDVVKMAKN